MKSRSREERVESEDTCSMWTDPKPSDLPMSRVEGAVKALEDQTRSTLEKCLDEIM